MSEWQPIETAPRDGTEVIITRLYNGEAPYALNMQWGYAQDGDEDAGISPTWCSVIKPLEPRFVWEEVDDEAEGQYGPSHWKPSTE